jgi:hypothetical protein
MFSKLLKKILINYIKKNKDVIDEVAIIIENQQLDHVKLGFNTAIESMGNALPDFFWSKDIEGQYIWANQAVIDGLLFTSTLDNTIGRNDTDISSTRRSIIGDNNHTFGIVCGDSDSEILKFEQPKRFLEYGKVNGEMMYLEVHKNILRNQNNEIIGTTGTGRIITDEYLAMSNILDKMNDNVSILTIKQEIKKLQDKYFFENSLDK